MRLICTHSDGRRFVYVPRQDSELRFPPGCWEVRAIRIIDGEDTDERVR